MVNPYRRNQHGNTPALALFVLKYSRKIWLATLKCGSSNWNRNVLFRRNEPIPCIMGFPSPNICPCQSSSKSVDTNILTTSSITLGSQNKPVCIDFPCVRIPIDRFRRLVQRSETLYPSIAYPHTILKWTLPRCNYRLEYEDRTICKCTWVQRSNV